ncbi:unnamed protein product [Protopolystoma xenopodis]|uniref:Uncharacterized protein n=1 Tax=Protopolystoma xenopodis TaxID=117903 RepID=A0A3S5B5N5_9PLAT|nr:unnamed protein product [Protopolystoma xenopodis]
MYGAYSQEAKLSGVVDAFPTVTSIPVITGQDQHYEQANLCTDRSPSSNCFAHTSCTKHCRYSKQTNLSKSLSESLKNQANESNSDYSSRISNDNSIVKQIDSTSSYLAGQYAHEQPTSSQAVKLVTTLFTSSTSPTSNSSSVIPSSHPPGITRSDAMIPSRNLLHVYSYTQPTSPELSRTSSGSQGSYGDSAWSSHQTTKELAMSSGGSASSTSRKNSWNKEKILLGCETLAPSLKAEGDRKSVAQTPRASSPTLFSGTGWPGWLSRSLSRGRNTKNHQSHNSKKVLFHYRNIPII